MGFTTYPGPGNRCREKEHNRRRRKILITSIQSQKQTLSLHTIINNTSIRKNRDYNIQHTKIKYSFRAPGLASRHTTRALKSSPKVFYLSLEDKDSSDSAKRDALVTQFDDALHSLEISL